MVRGFSRVLGAGSSRVLPALENGGLFLSADTRLSLTAGWERWSHSSRFKIPFEAGYGDSRQRQPLTTELSLAIFMSPEVDWKLATA